MAVDQSILRQAMEAATAQHGLPPGYLERTAQIESSMNPSARNPNSSAGGLFQFIDSTAQQYGLTNKFDPNASTDAAARLAADNRGVLQKSLGRDPTAEELYLAHQQGAGGASKLLSNPNARAVDVVGADAVKLNGGNPNMTAGEFAQLWTSKFGKTGAPDSPAPGATEAQGFAVPQTPEPSLGARFMAGGPGALFGAPQAGWNLADTGLGVGAALMARDNPQGAAALLKIKDGDRRTSAKQDVVSTSVINGGKSILQTKPDGSFSIKPSGIEGEAKPPPTPIVKEFTERHDNMGKLAQDASELAKFQELIADGKLDLSPASRAAAVARNVIGKSNENDRAIADFDAFVTRMTNNRLLLNKGVQTEGDSARAAKENFPGGSSYDNATALQRLQKLQGALKSDIGRVADINDGLSKTYKGIDTDGTFSSRAKEWRTLIDETEKTVGPKREAYLKARTASQQPATAEPAPEAPKEWRWTPKK